MLEQTDSKVHTIIHLGAGNCHEISQFHEQGARRIVLVEPNPTYQMALNAIALRHSEVEILNLAVAPRYINPFLYVVSNRRESSLLEPRGLFHVYPNLDLVERLPVEVLSPSELFSRISIETDQTIQLVVELQGLELAVLSDIPDEYWEHIISVTVRCADRPLYDGGSTAAEVEGYLISRAFKRPQRESSGNLIGVWRYDRDQVEWLQYQLNKARSANELLDSRHKQSVEECSGLIVALKQEVARLIEANGSQQMQLAMLASECETHKVEKQADEQRLAAIKQEKYELNVEIESLAQERNALRRAIDDGRTEIAQKTAELSDANAHAQGIEVALQAQIGLTTGLGQQIEELSARIASLIGERDGLRVALSQGRTELDEAVADYQGMKALLHEREMTIQSQETQIERLSSQMGNLNGQISTLIDERDGLVHAVTNSKGQLEQAVADNQGMMAIVQKHEMTIQSQEAQIAHLGRQMDELNAQISNLIGEREVLMQVVTESKRQIEQAAADHQGMMVLVQTRDVTIQSQEEQVADLNKQLDQLNAQVGALNSERDGVIRELTESKAALERAAADLQGMQAVVQQREMDFQSQENLMTAIVKEKELLNGQIESLISERDNFKLSMMECQSEMQKTIEACEEQNRIADGRNQEMFNVQIGEWQERVRQLQSNIDRLTGSIGQLSEELVQARQTANLATKLHMLREADLHDLQDRYKDAVNVQEKQHQLMLQLENKLRLASQYFHQLRESTVGRLEIVSESIPPVKPSQPHVAARKKQVNKDLP